MRVVRMLQTGVLANAPRANRQVVGQLRRLNEIER
jgi:hypothetical protein